MNTVKANQDIRKALKDNGFTLWMLADKLGVSEPTVVRMLRHELSQEKKESILKAIGTM